MNAQQAGQRLRRLREEQNITQEMIADMLSVSRRTVWRLETDDLNHTSVDTIMGYAAIVGAEVSISASGFTVRRRSLTSSSFELPLELSDLAGPDAGSLTLPTRIDWSPTAEYDISNDGSCARAYSAILTNGLLEDIESLVNSDRLKELWTRLSISSEVRTAWEFSFGGLRA